MDNFFINGEISVISNKIKITYSREENFLLENYLPLLRKIGLLFTLGP